MRKDGIGVQLHYTPAHLQRTIETGGLKREIFQKPKITEGLQ